MDNGATDSHSNIYIETPDFSWVVFVWYFCFPFISYYRYLYILKEFLGTIQFLSSVTVSAFYLVFRLCLMQITIWINFKYIILLLVFICTICSFCLFSAFWIEYFSEFNFIFTIDLLAIRHMFRTYSELHWIMYILTYSQLSNNVISTYNLWIS